MFYNQYEHKKEGAIRFYDLNSVSVRIACAVIFVICLFMVAVALFPAVWVFLSGFKDIKEFRRVPSVLPAAFDIKRYLETWNDLKFARFYVNSLISVAGSAVCAVLFNGLLAYGLSILRPRGHKVVLALVLWSLLIPPTTGIVALYVNINRLGMSSSFLPLWLSMGANAFWVLLFKQFFETIPKDYLEAAQLDGCSDLKIFLSILMPLSRPIISVVTIFAVTAAWSDFLLPYLVLAGSDKETVMVRLFAFRTNIRTTDVDILRAILFSIIPPTILFAVFQKQITKGIAAGGIKG